MPDALDTYDRLIRQRERGPRHTGGPGRQVGKLRIMTLQDAFSLPPRSYLLPGLIAPGELSTWWGAPKCGKTFLVMRLAFGLALGRGMWGRDPVRPLRVLYAAAEGEGGIATRLRALFDEMGDPGDRFALIAQRMQLGPPSEHLADLAEVSRQHRSELIIIDTLARTFGEGDEDRAQDMGGFIDAMDMLREDGGEPGGPMPHVAVIHHGSKGEAAKTPRGSGALLGAADLVVKVTKGVEDGPSLAVVEHAKDDADGDELPFRLRIVEVEQPGREPRKTCIAEEAEAGERGTKRPKLTAQNAMALSLLNDLIAAEGDILPAAPLSPSDPSLRCVGWQEWKDHCRKSTLSADGGEEAEKQAFKRAARVLLAARYIATTESSGRKVVWVARPSGT